MSNAQIPPVRHHPDNTVRETPAPKAEFSLLSNTSKMPGSSWSIPARLCKTGSKLRKIPNSVCSRCYALKHHYRFRNVQNCLDLRLADYRRDAQRWIDRMVAAIEDTDHRHFRWFDSGDLQDPAMFTDIATVCERTPEVSHWLPTRERAILRVGMGFTPPPPNLTVRLSATLIDAPPPIITPKYKGVITTSTVVTENATCPAPQQGNKCRDCRACWDRTVPNISYKLK